MFDSILDALGVAGQALSAPGDYLRGALTGRLGERASGRELLSSIGLDPGDGLGGDAAGFAAELASDPLTFAGAGLGRAIGSRASRAAEAMGPRYATTADDLGKMLGRYTADASELDQGVGYATRRAKEFTSSPNAARLLSEIPEGSSILGAGAEGMAFNTPAGDVLRIGRVFPDTPGRPVSENVLQATRATDIPNNQYASFRAERSPLASNVDDVLGYPHREPGLMEALRKEGLSLGDHGARNVGEFGGRTVVIDPGAVDIGKSFAGKTQPVVKAADPGLLMRGLLGMLNGDAATREALAAGLSGPNFANELTLAGGGLGSLGGAFARAGRN